MNTPLKILLGVVALFVIVAVGLAVAVALLIEPEAYRPLIVKAVQQQTGRSFDMQGELGLKLFPCCGIAIGPSTLGNPAGFPEQHFAKVDAAEVSLKIWPLLTRREVVAGKVTLDGLDLELLKLADGRANWEFEEPSTAAPAAEQDGGPALGGLTVGGVALSNARISYRDLVTQSAYTASNVQLKTGAIGADLAFAVELALDMADETSGASATVSATSEIALTDSRVRLQDAQIDLQVAGVGPAKTELKAQASLAAAEVDLDTLAGSVTTLDLNLAALGASARVTGGGKFEEGDAQVSGAFALQKTDLRQLMAAFSAAGYEPADSKVLRSLSGSAAWALEGARLTLADINLLLDDSRLTGKAEIADFATAAARFDLSVDTLDLDRYLAASSGTQPAKAATEPTRVPLDALAGVDVEGKLRVQRLRVSGADLSDVALTMGSHGGKVALTLAGKGLGGTFSLDGGGNAAAADAHLDGSLKVAGMAPRDLLGESFHSADPQALSRLSGETRWRLGTQMLALEQMSWQLDQTRISGNLRVEDLDRLKTRFDLSLDQLNLDAYLQSEGAESADGAAGEIPADAIRDLDIIGSLRVKQLTVTRIVLQNLVAEVRAVDGVLRFAPLQANLYGGAYHGTVTIDATGARTKLTLDQQLSAVQVGDMLSGVYGADQLAGALTMQLAASGNGNTQAELLQGLAGNFSLDLKDAVYRGVDVLYEVQQAQSLLQKEPPPPVPNRKETPIRALALTGKVLDGVLASDDLSAEIPYMHVTGKGGLNLVDRTVDYRLNAKVLRQPDAAGGASLASLVNANIPFTIKGAATAPEVRVDLKNLVMTTVRDRAIGELLQRLGGSNEPPTDGGAKTPTDGGAKTPAAQTGAATPQETEQAPDSAQTPEAQQAPKPESPEDLLKRGLRDLLKPRQTE